MSLATATGRTTIFDAETGIGTPGVRFFFQVHSSVISGELVQPREFPVESDSDGKVKVKIVAGAVVTVSGTHPSFATAVTVTWPSAAFDLGDIGNLSVATIPPFGGITITGGTPSSFLAGTMTFGAGFTITEVTPFVASISLAGAGSGTVTSVALALPAIFTVTNSPVTTSGTLTGTLATQAANLVWAGPTTGAAAAPTFRSLVAADIPSLSSVYQPLDSELTVISTLGSANQQLRVNAGGTAIEYFTPATAGMVVGTTAITSGTGGRVLYETAGNVLGEISGATSNGTTLTLTAPVLGAATATSINGLTLTSSTGTFTLTNLKTFAVTHSLTLSGTDSTVMTFPTTSATIARTDAANTFTGTQTIGALLVTSVNAMTITSSTGTFTLAAGKVFTVSNTLTLAGTDSTVMTFPTTTATIARTDAGQTFTGTQAFGAITATGTIVQTSASATAFESGPNGSTNPTFRIVNNVASAAAGISIAGNAAGAGVDIVAIGGANEGIRLTSKGNAALALSSGLNGSIRLISGNLGTAGTIWYEGTVLGMGLIPISWGTQFNLYDVGIGRNAAGVLETNNGTAGQWGALKAGVRDAGTTTVTNGLTIGHQSSGTPAAGLGSAILFNIDSSTTADQNAAKIGAAWTTATHASRTADIVFYGVSSAAALAETGRITGAGTLQIITPSQTVSLQANGSNSTLRVLNAAQNAWLGVTALSLSVASTGIFAFGTSGVPDTIDTALRRNAAGVLEVTGATAGQWGSVLCGVRDAGTNTVVNALTVGHQSSGTPAAGLGIALKFNIDSTTTADQSAGLISALWTTATHASRASDMVFSTWLIGVETEVLRLTSAKGANFAGIPRFNGTNSTGAGSAVIGAANSPAVTNTAVYTWISAVAADGSAVFIPCWK